MTTFLEYDGVRVETEPFGYHQDLSVKSWQEIMLVSEINNWKLPLSFICIDDMKLARAVLKVREEGNDPSS